VGFGEAAVPPPQKLFEKFMQCIFMQSSHMF